MSALGNILRSIDKFQGTERDRYAEYVHAWLVRQVMSKDQTIDQHLSATYGIISVEDFLTANPVTPRDGETAEQTAARFMTWPIVDLLGLKQAKAV